MCVSYHLFNTAIFQPLRPRAIYCLVHIVGFSSLVVFASFMEKVMNVIGGVKYSRNGCESH